MAGNIGYGFIRGTGEYINVETALEVTLEADTTYSVQIQGKASFCESASKPDGGGVYWDTLQPFGYKKGTDSLWVKPFLGETVFINIAE